MTYRGYIIDEETDRFGTVCTLIIAPDGDAWFSESDDPWGEIDLLVDGTDFSYVEEHRLRMRDVV